jgi:broad specificity phosphatase PhoE
VILLVRHGRTATNASGRFLGHADPELDEEGRIQAERLGAALGPVDRVISSPLRRTVATASLIDGPLAIDERFIELDYGEWDERPLSTVTAEEWARWHDDLDWAPPGGESIAAMGRRVRSALDDLELLAHRETIAIVTHVSPIKAGVAWALDVDDHIAWRLFVAPASVTRIDVGPARRSMISFNERH